MTLAFIQNIGPIEWIVLGVLFVGGIGVVAIAVWAASRSNGRRGSADLESRITRLEQQVTAMRNGRP